MAKKVVADFPDTAIADDAQQILDYLSMQRKKEPGPEK
jgi:hypothetical protein